MWSKRVLRAFVPMVSASSFAILLVGCKANPPAGSLGEPEMYTN
ncbi:MAG: hypothetical protein WDM87_17660 [Terracidiphilus sp.]